MEQIKPSPEIEDLFGDWEETAVWSCLQETMGALYAPNQKNPRSVAAVLGDFGFLAGKPDEKLARDLSVVLDPGFFILVPQNKEWERAIETAYPQGMRKSKRFAIEKEPGNFDLDRLRQFVDRLPKQYELVPIDEVLYERCLEQPWSRYFVCQYEDFESFHLHGLGFVILDQGDLVAGASSYSWYQEGIEIEIDTREDYRRQGLATVCGARLILECCERGLYPSWDAQNRWSVGLAEKLGYHFSHEYTAYEISSSWM